jgi:hypothetical protein
MPRELAVVTLASYRWPRFISLDGLVAPPLMLGRGIMPGCPGACAWAKAALAQELEMARANFSWAKTLTLNVHVDDVTAAVTTSSRREAVSTLQAIMP